MSEYRASKTQQKRLTALGIKFSQYITYNDAGKLLEAAGWTRDGREEQVHDDRYAGHYSSYSEYR